MIAELVALIANLGGTRAGSATSDRFGEVNSR
jgi:hypothetical protein